MTARPDDPRSGHADEPCATPVRMRLGAAAWLVGPAVLGAAAVVSTRARLLVLGGMGLASAWAALVATAAMRSRATPPLGANPSPRAGAEPASPSVAGADAPPPLVTVVVAARDEACVLPGLLRDLEEQDLRADDGTPRFDIVLVDDHSTDATPALMEAARLRGCLPVARVVRLVEGAALGKGGALRAVPPDELAGEFVCVLDADARIDRSFLRLAALDARAHRAITARRRILDRETSRRAAVQDDEQIVDAFIQRGRWALGGCPEFRGDGIVVERRLLDELGGWAAASLTEDLDLATRLAAAGIVVAVPRHLVVREAPVRTVGAFCAQRLRWAEGSLRRYLAHGPAVLRSRRLPMRARLEFAIYACQLAAPPLFLGALAAAAASRRPAVPAALAGAYLAGGAGLAFIALSSGSDAPSRGRARLLGRSVAVVFFDTTWAVLVPAALVRLLVRRGPPIHVPTPHG